jgi:hypothetical protein
VVIHCTNQLQLSGDTQLEGSCESRPLENILEQITENAVSRPISDGSATIKDGNSKLGGKHCVVRKRIAQGNHLTEESAIKPDASAGKWISYQVIYGIGMA